MDNISFEIRLQISYNHVFKTHVKTLQKFDMFQVKKHSLKNVNKNVINGSQKCL